MQTPHAFANRVPGVVLKSYDDVHRIDGIRTRIGPVRPIVLHIHSDQRIYFETLGYTGFLRAQQRTDSQEQRQ